MAKAKTKQRERINNDSYESTDNLGRGLVTSLKNDVAKGITTGLWEQLLTAKGEYTGKTYGDMTEGQEVSFKKEEFKKEAKNNVRIEAAIDYSRTIVNAERRIGNENSQKMSMHVEQILIELKQLAKSSKDLESQFREVTTVSMPKTPGKYHQNFFEWMLSIVKSARTRVESAEQWLKAVSGKGKKKDFWGMYKKHGTSFGLSGERTVAQQTG
jgi:hypothetical protein